MLAKDWLMEKVNLMKHLLQHPKAFTEDFNDILECRYLHSQIFSVTGFKGVDINCRDFLPKNVLLLQSDEDITGRLVVNFNDCWHLPLDLLIMYLFPFTGFPGVYLGIKLMQETAANGVVVESFKLFDILRNLSAYYEVGPLASLLEHLDICSSCYIGVGVSIEALLAFDRETEKDDMERPTCSFTHTVGGLPFAVFKNGSVNLFDKQARMLRFKTFFGFEVPIFSPHQTYHQVLFNRITNKRELRILECFRMASNEKMYSEVAVWALMNNEISISSASSDAMANPLPLLGEKMGRSSCILLTVPFDIRREAFSDRMKKYICGSAGLGISMSQLSSEQISIYLKDLNVIVRQQQLKRRHVVATIYLLDCHKFFWDGGFEEAMRNIPWLKVAIVVSTPSLLAILNSRPVYMYDGLLSVCEHRCASNVHSGYERLFLPNTETCTDHDKFPDNNGGFRMEKFAGWFTQRSITFDHRIFLANASAINNLKMFSGTLIEGLNLCMEIRQPSTWDSPGVCSVGNLNMSKFVTLADVETLGSFVNHPTRIEKILKTKIAKITTENRAYLRYFQTAFDWIRYFRACEALAMLQIFSLNPSDPDRHIACGLLGVGEAAQLIGVSVEDLSVEGLKIMSVVGKTFELRRHLKFFNKIEENNEIFTHHDDVVKETAAFELPQFCISYIEGALLDARRTNVFGTISCIAPNATSGVLLETSCGVEKMLPYVSKNLSWTIGSYANKALRKFIYEIYHAQAPTVLATIYQQERLMPRHCLPFKFSPALFDNFKSSFEEDWRVNLKGVKARKAWIDNCESVNLHVSEDVRNEIIPRHIMKGLALNLPVVLYYVFVKESRSSLFSCGEKCGD